jgi:hypothetical protein
MQNKGFLHTVVLLAILVAFTILVIVKEEGKISDFSSSATAAPRAAVPPVGVKEVNNTADNDDKKTNNTIDVDNGKNESENEDQIFNSNIVVVENNARLAVLPYFVLHVGPNKSGTSTIHSEFGEKLLEKLLRQDNYTYIGNAAGAVLDHTKLQKQNMATGTWGFSTGEFVSVLNEQRLLGHHVVGSSEYLANPSPEKCQAWKEKFLPKNDKDSTSSNGKKWDLQIVITFVQDTRLLGYLPSYWNKHFKLFRIVV